MRLSIVCTLAMAASSAEAFVNPQKSAIAQPSTLPAARRNTFVAASEHENEMERATFSFPEDKESSSPVAFLSTAATTASIWAATAQVSAAAGPDWGIFEGRIGSMLHPIMMFSLLAYSLYTAFLGWQWRRQRTIGDDITALKKTLPDLQGASSVKDALAAAKSADSVDQSRINALTSALTTESEIKALQDERKQLAAAGPRDQHFAQGALLAFLGTAFAIEGPLNTYARAGKLFPGPHLYAGAGLVVVWALAVATIPSMQKGNDTARSIHIGANVAGLGLFGWQVVSGLPIMFKVIEKTSWP